MNSGYFSSPEANGELGPRVRISRAVSLAPAYVQKGPRILEVRKFGIRRAFVNVVTENLFLVCEYEYSEEFQLELR